MAAYPITANCNFDTDAYPRRSVHDARKAVEAGLTRNAALVAALDNLEEVLSKYADDHHMLAIEACREAEDEVINAWTEEIQAEVHVARYGE